MSTITNGSNYLVSDPSFALLFSVNEHDGARSGRQDGSTQVLPIVPSTESSCATTKAIEVCVNGVKQVIIVPLALPDTTIISSSSLLPGYSLSSSSPAVSVDSRPDDVRLLAEAACVPPTSSTVPSFVKAEVLSAATNGHAQGSAVFTSPTSTAPSQYQLFGVNRIPFTNSLVEVPVLQNQSTAAAQQFHVRSRHVPPTTITTYPSPSYVPILSAPVMPLCGFPPAPNVTTNRFVEQRGAVPLPTPSQQPFPVSLSLYHPPQASQFNLASNSFRQVPRTSYGQLQMGSTRGGIINNTSFNNFYPLSQPSVGPPPTNSRMTSYQQFPPPLQRAVAPNFDVGQPQLQDYLLRKRSICPQGIPVDAGNYRVPQFGPSFLPNNGIVQRPAPVNANDMRAIYRNAPYPSTGVISSYSLQADLNTGSSDINRPRVVPTQQLHNGVLRSATSAVCQMNENAAASIRRKGTSKPLCKDRVSSTRPQLVSSQPSHTGFLSPVLPAVYRMTENSGASLPSKETQQARDSIRLLCCQPAAGIPIGVNPAQSATLRTTIVTPTAAVSSANVPVFSQISAASSYFQPVLNVPSHRQVTLNQSPSPSLPALSIAASSLQTVTPHHPPTDTNSHPAPAVQVSAAVESNSTNYSELEALLFRVSSDITPGSVPSNCSLTSDPSLTNLLSTSADLFLSSASASVADLDRDGGTESDIVQSGTGVGMETASTQSGDNSNDLGTLPADVMVDAAESESLLVSFCDMFERSDTSQQHPEQVSSLPRSSDVDKDSLMNVEQPQDSGVGVSQQKNETAQSLQFAKSLGKGRHFAAEMRQRRLEQASKKRRRAKLTSLEVDDDGNSSDSWHPDSHSDSSEYQSPSPAPSYESSKSQSSSQSESSEHQTPSSPAHSTASSKSKSSDDFVAVKTRQSRKRLKTATTSKRKIRSLRRVASAAKKRKNSSTVLISPPAVTKNCTVSLERLQLHGQQSVNIHDINSFICCRMHRNIETAPQRLVSSDSEGSDAEGPPIKKLRIKITRQIVERSDSSS